MGDTPNPPGAPSESPRQNAPSGEDPEIAHIEPSQIIDRPPTHPPSQSQQAFEQTEPSQHAFASQVTMAHQQGSGPLDLSSLASALPQYQQHYRPPHPYGSNIQRYNAATMAPPGTSGHIHAHFGAPSPMSHVPAQQYYIPQHTHAPQFYPTPLSPPQPGALAPRSDLGYYSTPVVMNQPPPPGAQYYYTPAGPFPAQAHTEHGQPGLGPYGVPSVQHQQADPRFRHPQSNHQEVNSSSPIEQQGNGMYP